MDTLSLFSCKEVSTNAAWGISSLPRWTAADTAAELGCGPGPRVSIGSPAGACRDGKVSRSAGKREWSVTGPTRKIKLLWFKFIAPFDNKKP